MNARALVLIVIGMSMLGGALIAIPLRLRKLASSIRTQATIASIRKTEEETGSHGYVETVHKLDLTFLAGATTIRFTHPQTKPPRQNVGDTIEVRYHPDDPQNTAEVLSAYSDFQVWFIVAVLALFGSALLFAGIQVSREA